MSFAGVHKKISLKASIVSICVSVLVPVICLQISLSIQRSKMDGDTPEICRLYLEQSAFVHDHFGRLHEERFIQDESATFAKNPTSDTLGLYTFKVTGTKATGILKMVWTREMGSGALTVSAIEITNERPLAKPVSDHQPQEEEPPISSLADGMLC